MHTVASLVDLGAAIDLFNKDLLLHTWRKSIKLIDHRCFVLRIAKPFQSRNLCRILFASAFYVYVSRLE